MAEKEELVDVVDGNDNVIGSAPRKGIHRTSLLHRSAHIFLIDPEGRIWLERRSSTTDTFPGYYSSSAAGHISRGESYLEGAKREALEELGIKGLALEQKHKLEASEKTSNEFVAFFVARSEERPRVHDQTESLEAFSISQIDRMIGEGKGFVPIFLMLFEWYKVNITKLIL